MPEKIANLSAALSGCDAYAGFNLAKVRHELRTPMNHIIGYSEILLEELDYLPGQEWRSDIEKIRSSGKQFESLLNYHLSESSLFEGSLDVERVIFNLRTVASQVIGYAELIQEAQSKALPESASRDLKKIIDSGQKCIDLTESQLREALLGRRPVSHPATASERSSADASSGPHAVPVLRPPLPGSLAEPIPKDQKARILFADDNQDNRRLLTRRLEKFGYQVSVVKDGREALEKLQTEAFDLALLDLVMPGSNGKETLRLIKEDPELESLPVVIMSAMDIPEAIAQCIELGAEDYLPSPIHPILLQARISAALEKRRLREFERLYLKQIQQEQEKSELLLLNVIPRPIVERLKKGEEYVVDDFTDVTVLFADLVGFTTLSQTMSAAPLSRILNQIFSAFDDLAEKFGLEKIKTIGDAYMAVSGLPLPAADHAIQVAGFALAIGEKLKQFSKAENLPLTMRIGIHSGPVSAGIIGRRKFTYDLWGETVNLASRMESHSDPGKIQVSERTAELLKPYFDLESRGQISIRGFGLKQSFWLIGEKDIGPRSAG